MIWLCCKATQKIDRSQRFRRYEVYQVISAYRKKIRELRPLIHCITNPISINQCANTILATGARPMMAEHPEEAALVTKSAGALMLNMGNITDVRKESMLISTKEAGKSGIRTVLDICGAASLPSRRDYAFLLINENVPSVIKGNYSEIYALYRQEYSSTGVDADLSLTAENVEKAAIELAGTFHTTILASGKTDIVTDGRRVAHIYNGTPQLSIITGTGCMQGALCAAFLSVAEGYEAAVMACEMLGICGELAETEKGSGTFMVNLLDSLSVINDLELESRIKADEKM